MHIVLRRMPGIVMLLRLNVDTLFTVGTVVVGLLAGAFLGTAIMGR